MNLYEFYHTINILCGFTIFIFCACRLGARQWKWQQLEFWVNLILLPSAVAMVVSPVPSANVLIFRLKPLQNPKINLNLVIPANAGI